MSNYICHLVGEDGSVRSMVPIVGSTEADAILIARNHFKSHGERGTFELWKGKVRILARGEIGDAPALPHINPITSAGC